jgi:hypothetical protein
LKAKSLFSTSPRTGREEGSGVLGGGQLIKAAGVLRWILPGYLSRAPDWEYCHGLELERPFYAGRSNEIGYHQSHETKQASFRGSVSKSFLAYAGHGPGWHAIWAWIGWGLTLSALVSKIRRSREFRGLVAQYQINPIKDNQTREIVSQGKTAVSKRGVLAGVGELETLVVSRALSALTSER